MNRVGIGYDVHRLVKGRNLVLGGVTIPYDLGLDGHSDLVLIRIQGQTTWRFRSMKRPLYGNFLAHSQNLSGLNWIDGVIRPLDSCVTDTATPAILNS